MPKKPEAKSKKSPQARPSRAKSPSRAVKAAEPVAPKAAEPVAPKAAEPVAPKAAAKSARPSRSRAVKKAAQPSAATAVGVLVGALKAHPQQKDLVSAGQQKDQLLRSLIPLYLARSLDVEVTSGTTSRFWGELGVTYAAPNAAKALRMNAGYAQETKKGKSITAKGIRYVEQAMKQVRG